MGSEMCIRDRKLAVPPARGLGSSATAIVAGLIGANAIMNSPLPKEKLLELAIDIEGHPDNVVPSLLGGLCLTARSSSQRWRIIRCDWHESIKTVVAIPAIRPVSYTHLTLPTTPYV